MEQAISNRKLYNLEFVTYGSTRKRDLATHGKDSQYYNNIT
jgi:hypothetical protein